MVTIPAPFLVFLACLAEPRRDGTTTTLLRPRVKNKGHFHYLKRKCRFISQDLFPYRL